MNVVNPWASEWCSLMCSVFLEPPSSVAVCGQLCSLLVSKGIPRHNQVLLELLFKPYQPYELLFSDMHGYLFSILLWDQHTLCLVKVSHPATKERQKKSSDSERCKLAWDREKWSFELETSNKWLSINNDCFMPYHIFHWETAWIAIKDR